MTPVSDPDEASVSPSSCQTRSLSDAPASEDFFGPHRRIADILLAIVSSEENGRTIGLAGSWGVGKSTVVDLLRQRIEPIQSIHLWVFDAWAHEGDPLRRSFLEDLIRKLADTEPPWLEPAFAKEWLSKLRGTHSRARTTSTPKVALGGYVLAVALLLIPFGTILLGQAVASGLTLDPGRKVAWPAVFGGAMMLAPVWLPIAVWLPAKALKSLLSLIQIEASEHPKVARLKTFLLLRLSEADALTDLYTPMRGVQVVVTDTDSFEEGEPTSIEFEECFTEVVGEATAGGGGRRRLVVVLDNLDRLPPEQAKTMWGTLQPFMQGGGVRTDHSLWLIVTYDRRVLSSLSSGMQDEVDSGPFGPHMSFVDKTIQSEFRVPYPVLADWRRYLRQLLRQALPEHSPEDFVAIGRLVASFFPRIEDGPTPRHLKKVVNSIGVLHRIWGHSIPLVDMAYFALTERRVHRWDSEAPIAADRRVLLSADVLDNLYSLEFGVDREHARHLRIGGALENVLLNRDVAGLDRMLAATPGALAVLERIVSKGIPDWQADQRLLYVSAALSQASSTDANGLAEEAAASLSPDFVVSEPNAASDSAMLATLRLVKGDIRLDRARRYASLRIDSLGPDDGGGDAEQADADELASLVSGDSWPVDAKLKVSDVALLHSLCSRCHVARGDRQHRYWSSFDISIQEIVSWFQSRVPQAGDWLLIRAAVASAPDLPLEPIVKQCQAVIQQPRSTAEAVDAALRSLLEFEAADALNDVDEAALTSGLESGLKLNDAKQLATALLLLGLDLKFELPDAVAQERHRATADLQGTTGHALFGLATELGKAAEYTRRVLLSPLFLEAERDAFLEELVKGIENASSLGTIPPKLIVDNAPRLRRRGVLKRMIQASTDIQCQEMVAELAYRPVGLRELAAFRQLLPRVNSQAMTQQLSLAIEGFSQEDWRRINNSFYACGDLADVLTFINPDGAPIGPAENLGPVLADLLQQQLSGVGRRPPRLMRHYSAIECLLPAAQVNLLAGTVYAAAVRGRVLLKAWFFDQYGGLLAKSTEIRRPGREVVEKILIPIIERRGTPVGALEWLAESLKQEPELLSTKGRNHRSRLSRKIEERLSDRLSHRQEAALKAIAVIVHHSLKR